MDLQIRGRKALLAGARAGIGKSTAMALVREGCEIVISARNEQRLAKVATEIGASTGCKISWVAADHGTPEGRDRLLAACPSPDILVITCSRPKLTPDLRDVSAEDWQESLSNGLLGPIELMKSTMHGMADRGWGRIVNITSLAVRYPVESRLLSGPPRHGVGTCRMGPICSRRIAPRKANWASAG